MVGMPGSGKSTLANQIATCFNAQYYSSDELRSEIFKTPRYTDAGDKVVKEQSKKCYAEMIKRTLKNVKPEQKVVLDATHLSTHKRTKSIKQLLQIVSKKDICFVTIKTAKKTTAERMKHFAKQQNNQSIFEIWSYVYKKFEEQFDLNNYSWPDSDHEISIYNKSQVANFLRFSKKMKFLSNIKAMAWDLDGTLYPNNEKKSKIIEQKKIQAVQKKLNINQKKAKKILDRLYKKYQSSTQSLNSLGIKGEDFFINLWHEVDLAKFIKQDLQLNILLEQTSGLGIKHTITTNSNNLDTIKLKLKYIGLDLSLFDLLLNSVEVGEHKPNPKIYQQLIEKICINPQNILVVGDRYQTDLVPAKKLKMKTCLVYKANDQADLSGVTPHQLLELMIFFKSLDKSYNLS